MVSYAYTAALIGAGFASGQEILCYFASFGRAGFIGVAAASALMAAFAYAVLRAAPVRGGGGFELLMGLFAFASYTVMLAAMGGALDALFHIPERTGALLAALCGAVLLRRGSDSAFRLSGIMGIVLTAGIAVCGLYMLRYREYHVFSGAAAVGSAAIYAGYNLPAAAPMLAAMGGSLRSSSDAAAVSAISGGVIFFLMSIIFGLLSIYSGRIPLGEFPMLTLAFRQSRAFGMLYGLMLIAAIVTTLLASGGSMARLLPKKSGVFAMPLVSAFAYALSGFGFSRLIDTAYRACGIIGLAASAAITAGYAMRGKKAR